MLEESFAACTTDRRGDRLLYPLDVFTHGQRLRYYLIELAQKSFSKFLVMERRKKMKNLLVVMAALTFLVGCESSKPVETEKPQPKPVELLTGRFGFYKLVVPAHGWARDAQPFSVDAVVNSDNTGKEGKAAIWRAAVASPAGHGL